jgi:protocatechuate 3,4-dioxygenase beta subunit
MSRSQLVDLGALALVMLANLACAAVPRDVWISGEVIDAESGTSVANIFVDVSEVEADRWWWQMVPVFKLRASVITDEKGRFEVRIRASRSLTIGPRCNDWPPSRQIKIGPDEYNRESHQIVKLKFNSSNCLKTL